VALLAEELVEEWLNRQNFFTIRGVKEGVGEMDLLAIRHVDDGGVEAWHAEVQVGLRPVTYMSNLTPGLARKLNKARGSSVRRNTAILDECVRAWVTNKFHHPRKVQRRNRFWPGAEWTPVLVHGIFKYPEELRLIGSQGVRLIPLGTVLRDLCGQGCDFVAAAGGDLASLMAFYGQTLGTRGPAA
jgi:hypothetical protein